MIERRQARFTSKRTGAGPTVLAGRVVVYDALSLDLGGFRERFSPGAFASHLQTKPDVVALIDHQDRLVLGRLSRGTLRLADGRGGLDVEIDVPSTSYGADVLESIRRGDMNQMSFAFKAVADRWTDEKIEGRSMAVRTVTQANLIEVSVVTFPAYPQSSIGLKGQRSQPGAGARRLALAMRLQELAEMS